MFPRSCFLVFLFQACALKSEGSWISCSCENVLDLMTPQLETISCAKVAHAFKNSLMGNCVKWALVKVGRKSPDSDDPLDPIDWLWVAGAYATCYGAGGSLLYGCKSIMDQGLDHVMSKQQFCDTVFNGEQSQAAQTSMLLFLNATQPLKLFKESADASSLLAATANQSLFLPKEFALGGPTCPTPSVESYFHSRWVSAFIFIFIMVVMTINAVSAIAECLKWCSGGARAREADSRIAPLLSANSAAFLSTGNRSA